MAQFSILIDRRTCVMRVWQRQIIDDRPVWRRSGTYPVAIGAAGHETPAGAYEVLGKRKDPDWHVPDTDWARDAGLTPGDVVPGHDPRNPIVGTFLQLTNDPTGNIGIHGTRNLDSLGQAASHGCIRVHPDVADSLHRRIPVGTPVVIV